MKKGGGKRKGGAFEREICKQLSLWITRGEKDDVFWRTAGSGARSTNRRKIKCSTANSGGDICLLDYDNDIGKNILKEWYFELKSGYSKKKQMHIEIDIKKNAFTILEKWMSKAIEEAKEDKRKHVALIFRRDRATACIAFRNKDFDYIRSNFKPWYWPNYGSMLMLHVSKEIGTVTIVRLDDFISWCRPKALYKIVPVIKRKTYTVGKYKDPREEVPPPVLNEFKYNTDTQTINKEKKTIRKRSK